MSAQENKALVQQFLEKVWNEGDTSAIDETLAADYVNHDPSAAGYPPGPEVYRQGVKRFRSAFPDLHTTIEDMVAEGDKVVVRGTDRATQQGEFMGVAPSGKPIQVRWINIYRIEDGKIAEQWMSSDGLGMLQQLGMIES